jgi:transposase-like protein
MNLKYQDEFRSKIVDLFRDGMTVETICEKYQISKSSVYNWIKLDSKHSSKNGNLGALLVNDGHASMICMSFWNKGICIE